MYRRRIIINKNNNNKYRDNRGLISSNYRRRVLNKGDGMVIKKKMVFFLKIKGIE